MILAGMGASRFGLFEPMKRATSRECKRFAQLSLCVGLTAVIRHRRYIGAPVAVVNLMNYEGWKGTA
jgi:hypothetical protein